MTATDLAFQKTGDGPPLVILHGLFGSKRNWAPIAKALAGEYTVIAADLRGHGDSPHARPTSFEAMAGDVARLIEAEAGGAAAVLGHSLGGKVTMWLALTRPERVSRLIAIDIAPKPYDGRDSFGFLSAMQALDLAGLGKRSEVDAALQDSVPDDFTRAFLLSNLKRGETGFRWAFDLDGLAEAKADLLGFPDPAGRQFDGDTLFLRGGNSDYVGEGDETTIKTLFPAARIETVPGAGHFVHVDAPEAVRQAASPAPRHQAS